ncbi:DUF4190 domain-containing protein [Christensenella intestinihominis]|uniref:DUF4190 domain-containing protein n=1 Tax=Christensenella intestinihominis TaxID=1851429 RepID=UPI000ACFD8BC|nr:DUF4190 domain-containing protein [Christensenella intestinihominis]
MICSNCNQSYDDNLNACPYCGAAKAAENNVPPVQPQQQYQQPQEQQPQQQYQPPQAQQQPQQQYQQPQYQQAPPQGYQDTSAAKSSATGSLVCGIIAIVMGLFVPIVGIILGIIALTLGNKAKRILPADQRGMANAGFTCGIIGLVIAVISWILNTVSLMSYWY